MSPESSASHVRTAARDVLASARVGDETRELFLSLVHDASAVALGPPPVEPLADTGPLPVIWDEPEPGRARRAWEWLRREQSRLMWFAVNGSAVFAIGIIFQLALIKWAHLSHDASYAVQTAVSVQVAFALSRYVTWRDRSTRLARAWLRFNTQQALVTGAGVLAYAGLDAARVGWVASNIIVTIALIPASFTASHLWSLREQAPAPVTREYAAVFRACARRMSPYRHPLAWVLAVQAVLSLRLVWHNTAFPDEALYLWAGHLEWQHWLHGTPIPAFPTYFSGAPAVYPPLGALASAAGGLAGARALSLCFTLIASACLYDVTRRMFTHRAGVFASALFGATAATQFLGAFATYDAMALSFLGISAWLAVISASKRAITQMIVLMASALALVIADAAKYAAVLWDPVVIGLVILTTWNAQSWKRSIAVSAWYCALVSALAAVALSLGGHAYWRGIAYTTLSRQHGTSSAYGIIFDSVGWVGVTAGLAIIGALIITRTHHTTPMKITAWLLAGAITLAPANQSRIHVFTSLFKHVGIGAWFASAIAGVALAALADAVPAVKRHAALRTSLAALAGTGILGALLAATHFSSWPDSSAFTAYVRPVLAANPGPVLAADNGNVIEYYDEPASTGTYFYGTWFFRYQDPQSHVFLTGLPAYVDAIDHQFFTVIALSFSDSQQTDVEISADITMSGKYRLTAVLPYTTGHAHSAYRVWVRKTDRRSK